jgi:hypothetical protein
MTNKILLVLVKKELHESMIESMDTMCCNTHTTTVLQKSFQYNLHSKLALLPTESFCKVCQERLFDHVELKPKKSLKNHHQFPIYRCISSRHWALLIIGPA